VSTRRVPDAVARVRDVDGDVVRDVVCDALSGSLALTGRSLKRYSSAPRWRSSSTLETKRELGVIRIESDRIESERTRENRRAAAPTNWRPT